MNTITEKQPLALSIELSDVKKYHAEPEKLVEKISQQASHDVFDIETKKGRDDCRSHAATIIKCITPAINASKELAADAQKVIKQDLAFRKIFDAGIREIADTHRRPLTEWEEEQKRIEAEKQEELKYLADWTWALDYNELDTLRKEKARQEALAQAEREKAARIERENQIKAQAKIDAERQAKAKIERAEREAREAVERAEREVRVAKEIAEQQRIAAEQAAERQKLQAKRQAEQAAIDERNRIEAAAKETARKADIAARNTEHRRAINQEILAKLMLYGLDEETAKGLIKCAIDEKLGQLKIIY